MKTFTLLIVFDFLVSCKDAQKPSYDAKKTVLNAQDYTGKKLMQKNCYVCHSPTTT
jgi:cytochrome c5